MIRYTQSGIIRLVRIIPPKILKNFRRIYYAACIDEKNVNGCAREKKSPLALFCHGIIFLRKLSRMPAKDWANPVIYICPWQPPTHIGGFRYVTEMAKQISNELDIDIAVHADHFHGFEIAAQAIRAGTHRNGRRFPLSG